MIDGFIVTLKLRNGSVIGVEYNSREIAFVRIDSFNLNISEAVIDKFRRVFSGLFTENICIVNITPEVFLVDRAVRVQRLAEIKVNPC